MMLACHVFTLFGREERGEVSHEVVEAVEMKYVGRESRMPDLAWQSWEWRVLVPVGETVWPMADRLPMIDIQVVDVCHHRQSTASKHCRISQERKNEDYEIHSTDWPSGVPAAGAGVFVHRSTHFDADSVMFERISGVQGDINAINKAAIEWRD
jgi:hypothetical protein